MSSWLHRACLDMPQYPIDVERDLAIIRERTSRLSPRRRRQWEADLGREHDARRILHLARLLHQRRAVLQLYYLDGGGGGVGGGGGGSGGGGGGSGRNGGGRGRKDQGRGGGSRVSRARVG